MKEFNELEIIVPAADDHKKVINLWEQHDSDMERMAILVEEKRKTIEECNGDVKKIKEIEKEYNKLIEDLSKRSREAHNQILSTNENSAKQDRLAMDLSNGFKKN